MKTAEHEMDFEQETKRATEEEEETGEGSNTSLLAGLNLVLIMSFLSLSAEDRSNFDEIHELETGDFVQHKHCVTKSSLQTRRRQIMSQFPAVERQSSRVHTKIRDSRHCRRF